MPAGGARDGLDIYVTTAALGGVGGQLRRSTAAIVTLSVGCYPEAGGVGAP
jgi:hypothetical protein